jgi:hypothetical protein
LLAKLVYDAALGPVHKENLAEYRFDIISMPS